MDSSLTFLVDGKGGRRVTGRHEMSEEKARDLAAWFNLHEGPRYGQRMLVQRPDGTYLDVTPKVATIKRRRGR